LLLQPSNKPQHRRLAAARRPNHNQELSRPNGKAIRANGRDDFPAMLKPLRHILQLHRRYRTRPPNLSRLMSVLRDMKVKGIATAGFSRDSHEVLIRQRFLSATEQRRLGEVLSEVLIWPGYCVSCGAWNPVYNRYCFTCGSQIPKAWVSPPGMCSRCFGMNPPYASYCGRCGARLK
jgi:ribosomal protein L40E